MNEEAGSQIIIINGVNLNLLGIRNEQIYGTETLAQIESKCTKEAEKLELKVGFFQSNFEGDIVEKIHHSLIKYHGVIINAAAYSHSSYAILDALDMLVSSDIPIIEVHISNIYAREEFRNKSLISPIASGVICGFGSLGYLLALRAMACILDCNI